MLCADQSSLLQEEAKSKGTDLLLPTQVPEENLSDAGILPEIRQIGDLVAASTSPVRLSIIDIFLLPFNVFKWQF